MPEDGIAFAKEGGIMMVTLSGPVKVLRDRPEGLRDVPTLQRHPTPSVLRREASVFKRMGVGPHARSINARGR